MLTPTAEKIFLSKYARTLSNGNKEDWAQCATRVAEYVAGAEDDSNFTSVMAAFVKVIYEQSFLPGGRTLANAGTGIKNLLNCFVLPVEDSRNGIYDTLRKTAEIFAWGGGCGFNFSHLRGEGQLVKTTGGEASGPLSFMSLFDQTGEVISQASRRGAQMGILNIDHPDIVKFINYKNTLNTRNQRLYDEYLRNLKSSGLDHNGLKYFQVMKKTLADDQLTHFNISVAIPDEFMKKVLDGDTDAENLLYQVAQNAWKSGDPGIFFLDRANDDNMTPFLGKIEASNPCLAADTLMATDSGLIPIKEMKNAWSTGIKSTYCITFDSGQKIKVTKDHKIFTESGWISAENLLGHSAKIETVPAFGLRGNFNEGLILGWLSGDGHFSRDNDSVLYFYNKSDKTEILPIVYSALSEISGKNYAIIHCNSCDRIDNRFISKLAVQYDFDGDSKFVNEALVSSKEFQRGYLSALFSADGSVQGNQKKGVLVRLSSSYSNLLEKIQLLLLNFGVYSKVYLNRRSEREYTWPDGKTYLSKAQHELIISNKSIETFFNNIGFLGNKNKKLESILSEYRRKINSDKEYTKVISSEYVGEQEVFDFNSPETHSGSANGILVHNCGEIPLLPYEGCCLGSLNLTAFNNKDYFDWDYLKQVIRVAVRFLDNVQTLNETTVAEINEMTRKTRRLGLGVMGLADVLADRNIPYDSIESLNFCSDLAKFIYVEGWKASQDLAVERGPFPAFDEETINWNVLNKAGSNIVHAPVRNVAITSVAPTGSIALLAGVNSGIEPFFAKRYKRNITEGIGNSSVASVTQGTKFDTKTAHDIHWKDHINMQAVWQMYTDNSISKTINMRNDVTVPEILDAYIYAWERGLKGITVYRDQSRLFQVLNKEE